MWTFYEVFWICLVLVVVVLVEDRLRIFLSKSFAYFDLYPAVLFEKQLTILNVPSRHACARGAND